MRNNTIINFINKISLLLIASIISICCLIFAYLGNQLNFFSSKQEKAKEVKTYKTKKKLWEALKLEAAIHEKDPKLVLYGHDLIANTSKYLGPKGLVSHISNGMNCQNCHLEAGTKPWGNNYGAVAATYPKFRERSGTKESIVKRVNDCIERSLNGKALDSTSIEMLAIVSYIKFIGKYVPKDSIPNGTGIWKTDYMERAADPKMGELAYNLKCISCHQLNGQGVPNPEGNGYIYPPLWGKNSYNHGAGLFRLSRLAGYIFTNMPNGTNWEKPILTTEEAWDIAAYINSQPRPTKDLSKDWPNIAGKPFDHPFGPFADSFSETQHKFGPYKPIVDFIKVQKKKKEEKARILATPNKI